MNRRTKFKILNYAIFITLFFVIFFILKFTFLDMENSYKALICGALTALLSPKIIEFDTQAGKQIQFKWIFLKKVISI
jgi:hypothetical protein